MSSTNFQGIDGKSNSLKGKEFELEIEKYFIDKFNITLKTASYEIGTNKKEEHKFDFENEEFIIECKARNWTISNHIPSGTMSAINEAMYYFSLLNISKRKVLILAKSYNNKRDKTVGAFYVDQKSHLIPTDVEIWEFDKENNSHKVIYPI